MQVGSKDEIGEPSLKAQKVAEKQLAVAKQTPAGQCIPYVDAAGRQYSFKIPAPEPAATVAAPLPDLVKLFAGTSACVLPRWQRYLAAKAVMDTDVVVLEDFQRDFFLPSCLAGKVVGETARRPGMGFEEDEGRYVLSVCDSAAKPPSLVFP